jgi:ELWxxDGT repeat protein
MKKLCGFAALFGLLVLLRSSAAEAQTASLVADINPSFDSNTSSNPRQLTAWGGKVLFSAGTRNAGAEVWVTDGTAAGTRRLTDACPGRCGSAVTMRASVKGGVILSLDRALWRSDGTRAGTVPLVVGGEPLSLANDSSPGSQDFAVLSRKAYFSACTPSLGCGGWRSDGTLAGTEAIGPFPSSGNPPRLFRAADDRVFFVSFDDSGSVLWTAQGTGRPTRAKTFPSGGTLASLTTAGSQAFLFHGSELWASDGTPAGTRLLHTFRSLPTFGAWIKPAAGRVYLLADEDGSRGQQIWQSDGTPEGTRRMTEFNLPAGLDGLDPDAVDAVGDQLVFLAANHYGFKVWTVSPATAPVAADLCGDRCSLGYDAKTLTPVGGRLLFVAQDDAHGEEPWTTDGTPAGTARLVDTCPGSCGGGSSAVYPEPGAVFFQAAGSFWRTDGTAAGTRRVSGGMLDISPELTDFVALGDRLFFVARTADYSAPTYYDRELWTSDGTPGGTRIVTDLENGAASSFPTNFVALGDGVFFLACADDLFGGQELWHGTAAGAEPLTTGSAAECGSTSSSLQVVRAGQHLFLWRTDQYAYRDTLWASDGTAAGTRQVTTHGEDFSRGETRLVPFKDRIYWMEGDDEVPNEVWTSDGSVAGTRKAFDLPDPATPPIGVVAAGEALYVLAIAPQAPGFQIWRTDGTAAGLHKVFTTTTLSAYGGGFDAFGSSLVAFLSANASPPYQLWKVDGAGSVRVHDFFGRSRDVVTYGGAFYFFNQTDGTGNDFGLWRSDGTAAGTSLVYHFPSPGGLDAGELHTYATVFAGRLFFAIDDRVHGAELWSSDGTSAGTAMVKDLFPGAVGAAPADLAVAGGRLFFSADDGVHGFELFESDGTAAGTRLVEDLAPETDSSYPAQMTVAGDRLYFAADDGLRGTEPWSFPLAGPAGCQPSAANLCLNGGRFKVEVSWRTPDGRTGAGQAVGLSADTGYFWFFDPANVETVVKVLDGRSLNGHFWVFYGALSNVEYTLTVTDTQSGLVRHYFNPVGQFGSVGDTQAFGPLGSYFTQRSAAQPPPAPAPRIAEKAGAAAACQPSSTRLCLNGNRFAVEATWEDFSGHSGSGHAVSLTGDTGTFWFFDPSNVEVILKVLDARAVNGKFWVFYGALSNVEYTLRVTDTATGKVRTYTNPAGRFASAGDSDAF